MEKLVALLLLAAAALPLGAGEPWTLVLRNHDFIPARLEVPAHAKFRLLIRNEGDKTMEWESDELDREEVIAPNEERAIFLGPLEPGEYPFYDDRHQDSKGVLVAK